MSAIRRRTLSTSCTLRSDDRRSAPCVQDDPTWGNRAAPLVPAENDRFAHNGERGRRLRQDTKHVRPLWWSSGLGQPDDGLPVALEIGNDRGGFLVGSALL